MYDIAKQRSRERQLAWQLLRNSPTVQMLSMKGRNLMPEVSRLLFDNVEAGRELRSDNDCAYYEMRSEEERVAAQNARGIEARRAHEELSNLYGMLSRRPGVRRSISSHQRTEDSRSDMSEAGKRQDALLADALKKTFPASDPVSDIRIH